MPSYVCNRKHFAELVAYCCDKSPCEIWAWLVQDFSGTSEKNKRKTTHNSCITYASLSMPQTTSCLDYHDKGHCKMSAWLVKDSLRKGEKCKKRIHYALLF